MIMTHMSEADIWTPQTQNAIARTTPKAPTRRPAPAGELKLAYAVGFLMILPVVFVGRLSRLGRERPNGQRSSLFGETRTAVLTALGFSLMGR